MITYIVRRILVSIPVLWGVLTLVFISIHLIPGDPAQVMLFGRGHPADIAALRHQLGLDQPLPVQYWSFRDARRAPGLRHARSSRISR